MAYTGPVSQHGTVWLVGMMGAGKSTVGPALARRLSRQYGDTDEEIVRAAGCSIAELFESEGEAGFRDRERQAIETFAGTPAVVALGGGAVAPAGAAERLAATGTMVYLRARPETLLRRVGDGRTRPLLSGLDAAERDRRLAELLEERRVAYESAAVVVDTDGVDIGSLVEELATRIEEVES